MAASRLDVSQFVPLFHVEEDSPPIYQGGANNKRTSSPNLLFVPNFKSKLDIDNYIRSKIILIFWKKKQIFYGGRLIQRSFYRIKTIQMIQFLFPKAGPPLTFQISNSISITIYYRIKNYINFLKEETNILWSTTDETTY